MNINELEQWFPTCASENSKDRVSKKTLKKKSGTLGISEKERRS